jgi:hypothetical protein
VTRQRFLKQSRRPVTASGDAGDSVLVVGKSEIEARTHLCFGINTCELAIFTAGGNCSPSASRSCHNRHLAVWKWWRMKICGKPDL